VKRTGLHGAEAGNTGGARGFLIDRPGVGRVNVEEKVALQIQTLQQENHRLTFELCMKYTRPNAPCFCGSREKFKLCHGAPMRRQK
jgi:hypothetical protein